MRIGRPKKPLVLTEEKRDRLQSLAHPSRSRPLLARRARVVGLWLDNQAVANKLRCSRVWLENAVGMPVISQKVATLCSGLDRLEQIVFRLAAASHRDLKPSPDRQLIEKV